MEIRLKLQIFMGFHIISVFSFPILPDTTFNGDPIEIKNEHKEKT